MLDLRLGDSADILVSMDGDAVDLIVTSPPYDHLRTYDGHCSFDFETIARELNRVLKPGGMLVWIVGDATRQGSETGTSFRQALHFMSLGLSLHDTMLYGKHTCPFPSKVRYNQSFEYMFCLSKGAPKTVNLIKDRPNVTAGRDLQKRLGTRRQIDGSLEPIPEHRLNKTIASHGTRENIWFYKTGIGMHESTIAHLHPATFPLQLVKDHITSWSNAGDLVLDPFMGSGTTAVAARDLGRRFIGIEINPQYMDIARRRLDPPEAPIVEVVRDAR